MTGAFTSQFRSISVFSPSQRALPKEGPEKGQRRAGSLHMTFWRLGLFLLKNAAARIEAPAFGNLKVLLSLLLEANCRAGESAVVKHYSQTVVE